MTGSRWHVLFSLLRSTVKPGGGALGGSRTPPGVYSPIPIAWIGREPSTAQAGETRPLRLPFRGGQELDVVLGGDADHLVGVGHLVELVE